jgi:hypothetical protein
LRWQLQRKHQHHPCCLQQPEAFPPPEPACLQDRSRPIVYLHAPANALSCAAVSSLLQRYSAATQTPSCQLRSASRLPPWRVLQLLQPEPGPLGMHCAAYCSG